MAVLCASSQSVSSIPLRSASVFVVVVIVIVVLSGI
jgi:hypothetical protein